MRSRKLITVGVAAVVLSIAASAKGPGSIGRFQTVIGHSGSVVMTDTTTGQVWNTDLLNPAVFRNEEFKLPKAR